MEEKEDCQSHQLHKKERYLTERKEESWKVTSCACIRVKCSDELWSDLKTLECARKQCREIRHFQDTFENQGYYILNLQSICVAFFPKGEAGLENANASFYSIVKELQ